MSEMEMFIGTAKRYVGPDIKVEDTDEFYELEQELGHSAIVKVGDELWCIDKLEDVDAYGFQTIIEPQSELMFIGYWYNGGGGIHEVSASAIKDYLKSKEEEE
ncbi:hypothetical protein SUFG_00028 [Sulfitobacter phage phiCB2047-B]|uniref:Uncharacterized protein n=1 Tax=Sulfitobacter phage phiCB2047-B TaxID=754046 RepID=M4PMR8_9CAUD|nr:hypothetical protein SUFG_00028 [Sulfitobacter phage phiCB2047-B]AGH07397.1 hypothetical protein SUFG_00028 [Sulfitobacter phage phiCB2047-B]